MKNKFKFIAASHFLQPKTYGAVQLVWDKKYY